MNRAQQPRAGVPNGSHVAAPGAASPSLNGKKKVDEKPTPRWFRWTTVTLLFSVAILVAALTAYIGFRGSDQESKFVNKNELQAVFVNVNGTSGGQVYFGNIQELTTNYIRLTNVFYIQNQSSTSSQNQSYTLVKLGCELHGPEDEMVINRDQVFFWENLKSSGQVSQKVSDYYKQNPNGQNCSQSSASNSTSQSNSTTQSSTNSSSTSSSTTGKQ